MSESVILCEGYHDRAFWTGWLEHLGCENLAIRVLDPWNNLVRGGDFAFRSKSGAFLRIVPCRGKDNILPTAHLRLRRRNDKRLVRLVLSMDSDASAQGPGCGRPALTTQAVETLMRHFGEPHTNEQGEFVLDDGATLISLIRWETSDANTAALPSQQTLERLACAAVVAAYPDRGPVVQQWLESRGDGPAWSYMAGWYAEFGCEGFYRKLWDDEQVAAELKSRLIQCGAWRVAETLAE